MDLKMLHSVHVTSFTDRRARPRRAAQRGIRRLLIRLLIVALSFASVSVTLSALPGATTSFWYLYLSPVFVAAMSFGVRGALVGSAAVVVALTSLLSRLSQFLAQAPDNVALQIQLLGGAPQSGLRHITDLPALTRAGEGLLHDVTLAASGDAFALVVGQVGLGLLCMIVGACIIGRQADAQRRQDALIRDLALKDNLTGLANHRGLMERLDDAVFGGAPFSVLLIDIDGLKSINDQYSHEAGDLALQHVGRLLQASVRTAGDLAARHGGDEFAIVVSSDADGSAGIRVAERLLQALDEHPFQLPHRVATLAVHASIGVAVFDQDGSDPGELLAVADQGMYAAKQAGGQAVFRGIRVPRSSHPTVKPGWTAGKAVV